MKKIVNTYTLIQLKKPLSHIEERLKKFPHEAYSTFKNGDNPLELSLRQNNHEATKILLKFIEDKDILDWGYLMEIAIKHSNIQGRNILESSLNKVNKKDFLRKCKI